MAGPTVAYSSKLRTQCNLPNLQALTEISAPKGGEEGAVRSGLLVQPGNKLAVAVSG